jgi:hypothetical protein
MGEQYGIANRQDRKNPATGLRFPTLFALGPVGGFNNAQKIASHECPSIKYVYIGRFRSAEVAKSSLALPLRTPGLVTPDRRPGSCPIAGRSSGPDFWDAAVHTATNPIGEI